jgi:uncharacterized membrane protein
MDPYGVDTFIDEGDMFHDVEVVGGFGDPTMGGGFEQVFGLFLFVVAAVLSIAMAVRRAKRLHDAGIDPLDPETDLQVRLARSRTMSPADSTHVAERTPVPGPPSGNEPAKTVEERLADVDRLYAAGTITPSERDAARSRILASI